MSKTIDSFLKLKKLIEKEHHVYIISLLELLIKNGEFLDMNYNESLTYAIKVLKEIQEKQS